jgi:hypothetical protein
MVSLRQMTSTVALAGRGESLRGSALCRCQALFLVKGCGYAGSQPWVVNGMPST